MQKVSDVVAELTKKEFSMSKMDVATKFFHACEGLEGRAGCAQYVADGASFEAQSEPVAELTLL